MTDHSPLAGLTDEQLDRLVEIATAQMEAARRHLVETKWVARKARARQSTPPKQEPLAE